MEEIKEYCEQIKNLSIMDIQKKIYEEFDDYIDVYNYIAAIIYDEYGIDLPFEMEITDSMKRDRNKQQQTKFREKLLKRFDRCLLCDCTKTSLLQACHIVDYRDCKNYDEDNGIVLCYNHHKEYDNNDFYIDSEYNVIEKNKCENIKYSNLRDKLEMYSRIRKYLIDKIM
jgi:predicted restriction endonuclease